ncbi:EAL domain-containing protein [Oceanicoccus sp. KOV_DT_Chl]|uniref:EAL domain-containing protein n=1 Tax=Oceanicoccus sp. KOV_DT_Chl TaxID=1904639 RepID=UPI000C7BEFEC|nr:EAL domain-containing protein [Oceanicoccus sp. KOV_DT_Chl]
MAAKSLTQSIFRLVAGVVLLTALTIIINVWMAAINQAQERLDRSLEVAQNVLEQSLNNREKLLINSAGVLTDDFGFKQAVATADVGTIESALLNHGERINADLMALISLDGKNITSSPPLLAVDEVFSYPELLRSVFKNGGASALILLHQELYQVIMLSVDAPAPLAIALVGFKLDDALITQLKNISQLETTIQVLEDNTSIFSISTLNDKQMDVAISQLNSTLDWFSSTFSSDVNFASRQFQLANEFGYQTNIILSEDVDKLFSDFNALQLTIGLIAFAAVLLAVWLAALFSNKLARPLVRLAELAKNISQGDYSKRITLEGSTEEVSQLSSAFNSMQTNIRVREEEIVFRAQHDILTSVFNRYHIETVLDEKFLLASPFLAIGINIFGFRDINDIFGYSNGDLCLKELAKRVASFDGLAARLTGGELLWVPNQELSLEDIAAVKKVLELPIDTGEVVINLKVVMGLLYCPSDAGSAEELFRRMNIVLDESQATKQLTLNYSQQLEERYLRRLSIITELKNTLKSAQHELNLYYQPKLNLTTGKVTSAEALIRWNNARLGFVSPEDFIAIAEQAGFIETVTQWVIRSAIEDAAKFKQAGIQLCIAINLSARDVMNTELLPYVMALLKEFQLDESYLSFEITEGDLVRDPQRAIEHLNEFRAKGFSLAIDDFGTGYSSMAYLKNLPINILKVDKSFVLNLNTNRGDQNIVQSVIKLAHSFNLSVVAEGVENPETLALLSEWGCEYAQGYYMSKPVPVEDCILWHLENQNTKWC